MTPAQLIGNQLLNDLVAEARASPRLRKNYNFHSSDGDNPHRFLNALVTGTYVRPHRHTTPPKPEAFVVLRGYALLITFDDSGAVTQRYMLGDDLLLPDLPAWLRDYPTYRGVDLEPGVWHTIVPVTDVVIIYEVKPGPYSPAADKDFAPWAPAEGAPEAAAFNSRLMAGADR